VASVLEASGAQRARRRNELYSGTRRKSSRPEKKADVSSTEGAECIELAPMTKTAFALLAGVHADQERPFRRSSITSRLRDHPTTFTEGPQRVQLGQPAWYSIGPRRLSGFRTSRHYRYLITGADQIG
jgi:hypothetical protein